jgi:hypothetical protein
MSLEIPFQVGDVTYHITSSDKSYEISEYRNIKPVGSDIAVPTLCPIKWFGSMEGVIIAALNMQVRASDARSLAELKEVVAEAYENITKEFQFVLPHIKMPPHPNPPRTRVAQPPPGVPERRRRTT